MVLAAEAASAAAPGMYIDTGKFEGANVSVTVASQVSILPFGPWNQCKAVWAFGVRPKKSLGFFG